MSATTEALLEGSLRDVALGDVLQLLELGRRTGVLRVVDPLGGRRARVTLLGGRIRDAEIEPRAHSRAADDPCETVIELLGWTAGRFAVEPLDAPHARPWQVTLGVDTVLMEAARRADEWARLTDRVPGPAAVPRLAAPGAAAVAPVALAPDEWSVLAYADGEADLRTLASRTGRDPLAVARAVHRLLGEGFLTLAPAHAAVPPDDRRSSVD